MGSAGSGRLSDYSGARPKKEVGSDGGTGFSGGQGSDDLCGRAFSANLEEVQRSEYFKHHGMLPTMGDPVSIAVGKRLQAVSEDGRTIGYLPTKFNYLLACIEEGFSYAGQIASVTEKPLPKVAIDVMPTES